MAETQPLWKLMAMAPVHALFDTGNNDMLVLNCRIATELRTIAKEAKKQFACFTDTSGRIAAETMVNWLLAEADRAEAGE